MAFNPYSLLGIEPDVSEKEIKNAYRRMALKYHPDKFEGDKSVAEKQFDEIRKAYEFLSDKDKRAEYDKEQRGVRAKQEAKEKKLNEMNSRRRRFMEDLDAAEAKMANPQPSHKHKKAKRGYHAADNLVFIDKIIRSKNATDAASGHHHGKDHQKHHDGQQQSGHSHHHHHQPLNTMEDDILNDLL